MNELVDRSMRASHSKLPQCCREMLGVYIELPT